MEELVEENLAFAKNVARYLFPRHEDVRDEVSIILVEAARDFHENEHHGYSFRAFLYLRIKRRLIDYYRVQYGRSAHMKEMRRRVNRPIKFVVSEFESEENDVVAVDPLNEHEQIENLLIIEAARKRLSAREWFVHSKYAAGWQLKEIGEMLGVTESRVCQIKRKSQKKMIARIDPHLVE